MPLSLQHRHAVLLADRTRDVRTITTVVREVLAANPQTISKRRAAAGQAYLVANLCSVCQPGTPRWLVPA